MRIFSKFKDYYDGALSVFNDPFIVYERHTRKERVIRQQELPSRVCTGRNEWFDVFNSCQTLFHIGLCGKWFHCYRYQRSNDPFDAEYHYVKQEEIQEKVPWFSKGDPIVDMDSDPFWKHDIFVQFNSPILAVGYDGSKYRPHSKNYAYTVIVNPQLTAIPISEMIQCGLDNINDGHLLRIVEVPYGHDCHISSDSETGYEYVEECHETWHAPQDDDLKCRIALEKMLVG